MTATRTLDTYLRDQALEDVNRRIAEGDDAYGHRDVLTDAPLGQVIAGPVEDTLRTLGYTDVDLTRDAEEEARDAELAAAYQEMRADEALEVQLRGRESGPQF